MAYIIIRAVCAYLCFLSFDLSSCQSFDFSVQTGNLFYYEKARGRKVGDVATYVKVHCLFGSKVSRVLASGGSA